jgi:hypothetical protein
MHNLPAIVAIFCLLGAPAGAQESGAPESGAPESGAPESGRPEDVRPEDVFDGSSALRSLLMEAIELGIRSVRPGQALVPFALIEAEGRRGINRYASEPYEKGVQEAKAELSKAPPQVTLYAIAYEGFVTLDGEEHDAVIVHAGERGKGRGYLLAQRYSPPTDAKPAERVGNATILMREDSLLSQGPAISE